ncbi:MAG: thioredoxin-disulfide reductase [Bacteroidales bacterium]
MERIKCLIIGSGPAGYTAGIYAARANLKPVIIEGLQPGGQPSITTDVENFPGYPEGVSGPQMMEDMKKQAQRFGTEVRFGIITEVDFSTHPFKLKGDPGIELEADSVIIATGATARYLGLESEDKFKGRGVSACATCDGFFYKGKDVAVVGGGDSAAEEATYLAGLARKVYIIVRKDYMRASKLMQARVNQTKNIEVLYQHTTKEVLGDDSGVTGVLLHNAASGKDVKIDIDGFFLAIGHTPNSGPFKQYVDTDENNYIITKPDTTHTRTDGVFACGDVQDSRYRQSVTAAASGCKAALDAEKYLAEKDIVETGIIN